MKIGKKSLPKNLVYADVDFEATDLGRPTPVRHPAAGPVRKMKDRAKTSDAPARRKSL